jgi:hypothetical protein
MVGGREGVNEGVHELGLLLTVVERVLPPSVRQ